MKWDGPFFSDPVCCITVILTTTWPWRSVTRQLRTRVSIICPPALFCSFSNTQTWTQNLQKQIFILADVVCILYIKRVSSSPYMKPLLLTRNEGVSDKPKRTLDHPSPHCDICLGIVLRKRPILQPCFAFLTIPPKPSYICSSKMGWNAAKLPSLFSLGAESWYISETTDKTGPVNTYNFIYKNIPVSALLFFFTVTEKRNLILPFFLKANN